MTIDPFDDRLIAPVEMQEYLLAASQAKKVFNTVSSEVSQVLITDLREILRLHRFTMFNWLLLQGISIPMKLLADDIHPQIPKNLKQRIEDLL